MSAVKQCDVCSEFFAKQPDLTENLAEAMCQFNLDIDLCDKCRRILSLPKTGKITKENVLYSFKSIIRVKLQ